MKQEYDLIVVGAGMVGASAALAFAQTGYRVAVLERGDLIQDLPRTEEDIDLRVSALSPASQRLLQDLGVWQMIPSVRRCDYQRMRVWHEHGSVQMNFAAEQVAAPMLGTIVENRTVQAALSSPLLWTSAAASSKEPDSSMARPISRFSSGASWASRRACSNSFSASAPRPEAR